MKQTSLFEEFTSPLKDNTTLIISKSNNKLLSKEQITFNKHSQKIEKLREKIKTDTEKFDRLLAFHSNNVVPEQKTYANHQVEFAKAIYSILKEEKLSKVNKEKLSDIILSNLNTAFQFIVPDKEAKAIYDALSPQTYAQVEAEQMDEMKEMMEEMFRDQFGVDVDFSDTDMGGESFARKIAEMKEQIENKQGEQQNKQQGRKKTKKQIELEIQKKQTEELQKKNVRSIYMSLAKLLHPDLESDENLKIEREELMKQVTSAYQEGDLHTLLKLEIEIIHKQSENLDHLTDEKLKFLNTVLKDQIDELDEELYCLRYHPRYQSIAEVMTDKENVVMSTFSAIIEKLRLTNIQIAFDISELKGKDRLSFINSELKIVNRKKEMFFDDIDEDDITDLVNMLKDIANFGNKRNNKPKNKKRK